MKNKINWMEQVVSLIVVFIGITAGFILNDHKADSYEQGLELKYLQGFQDNISSNIANLDEVIPENNQERDVLKRFISSMQKESIVLDTALNAMQMMLSNSQFYYHNNTYDDMKSSGNLRIIKNYKLKEAIVLYHANLKNLKLLEDVYYDFSQTYAWPLAIENFDLLNNSLKDENIINSVIFRNTITGYYSVIVQRIERYQQIYEESGILKKLLAEEINTRS